VGKKRLDSGLYSRVYILNGGASGCTLAALQRELGSLPMRFGFTSGMRCYRVPQELREASGSTAKATLKCWLSYAASRASDSNLARFEVCWICGEAVCSRAHPCGV